MYPILSAARASLLVPILLLSACASTTESSQSSPEEEDNKALAECFEKFDNWPTQRLACINNVRTSKDPDSFVPPSEEKQ